MFVLTTEIVSRPGVIQKANVMYVSKEAMNKNQTLKMKLLLSSDDKSLLDIECSKMFFFLPSTTDRKEKINQFFKNVSLHPIDCRK